MTTSFKPASVSLTKQSLQESYPVLDLPAVQPDIPNHLDKNKVTVIRTQLRQMSAIQLANYSPTTIQKTSAAQQQMLDVAKASDIDVLETGFSDIIKLAKGLDVSKVTSPKTGFLSRIKNKFIDVREDLIKEHSSASSQIARVFASCDQSAKAISSRVPLLEQLHIDTQQEYIELDYMIAAGHLEIGQRKVELELLKGESQKDPGSIDLQNKLQEAQFYLQQLEIKVSNDERDQQMAFNTLPQIRMMQSSALTLGQTFATIQGSVMQNWNKQFTISLIGNEQQRGAAVANKVLDLNNQLAINNAKMVRQTSNEVIRSNQRGTYDLATLQTVHNETIGTIEDAFKLAQEGRQQREQISKSVIEMKQQMVKTFSTL